MIALWPRTAMTWAAAASVVLLLGLAWWTLRQGNEGAQVAAVGRELPEGRSKGPVEEASDDASTAEGMSQDRTREESRGSDQQVAGPATAKGTKDDADRPGASDVRKQGQRPVPVRAERIAPLIARVEVQQRPAPVDVPVAEVAISAPPVTEESPSDPSIGQVHTLPELFAAKVREDVLGRVPDTRPLDQNDAIAAIDKGLGRLSGGRAGIDVARPQGRRRMTLRLGEGLAIATNTGR